MKKWTAGDTAKSVAVGAAFVLFASFEGSTLIDRLRGAHGHPSASAAGPSDEAAHREALALERRFPMIDVIGYGHASTSQHHMTYVVFGVVDTESVHLRSDRITLALFQMASRLAGPGSDTLLLVHLSLREEVITGEMQCPLGNYTAYPDLVDAGCEATLYPPEERTPLPQAMVLWPGVGR